MCKPHLFQNKTFLMLCTVVIYLRDRVGTYSSLKRCILSAFCMFPYVSHFIYICLKWGFWRSWKEFILFFPSYFYTQCILNISSCKTAVRFSNWLYDPASKLQQYTVCQCRHLIFTSFFSDENLSTKFGQKEVKLQYWTKPRFYSCSRRFNIYGYGGRSLRPLLLPMVLFVVFLVFFQNGGWNASFLLFSLHRCNLSLD